MLPGGRPSDELHIAAGLANPFLTDTPRLALTLRGHRRSGRTPGSSRPQRLPITPDVLRALYNIWNRALGAYLSKLLWAACCTGFFGFLRAGEFTVDSAAAFDPEAHLTPGDVAFDSLQAPSLVAIRIKQSKTDPFRQEASVVLGRTGCWLCPVAALAAYLAVRSWSVGPLFRFESGAPLSRSALVIFVRAALRQAGLPAASYSGHSFRIGVATTAASLGLEDSAVRALGRWRSSAFHRYIRHPPPAVADFSCRLASSAKDLV